MKIRRKNYYMYSQEEVTGYFLNKLAIWVTAQYPIEFKIRIIWSSLFSNMVNEYLRNFFFRKIKKHPQITLLVIIYIFAPEGNFVTPDLKYQRKKRKIIH